MNKFNDTPNQSPIFGFVSILMLMFGYFLLYYRMNFPPLMLSDEAKLGYGMINFIIFAGFSFIGIVSAIVGLLRHERKRWFSFAGLFANGLVPLYFYALTNGLIRFSIL